MLVKKTSFVNTIYFLEDYWTNMPTPPEPHIAKDSNQHPQHLGDILKSIVQSDIRPLESNQLVWQRILTIEQKIEYLTHRIEEINKALE
jgi:hypothetical protein